MNKKSLSDFRERLSRFGFYDFTPLESSQIAKKIAELPIPAIGFEGATNKSEPIISPQRTIDFMSVPSLSKILR